MNRHDCWQLSPLLLEVEKEIAQLLLEKLEHFDISLERASQIARFVLNTLPADLTDNQVRQIIPSLDDEFFELSEIVYKHMKDYEEEYKPFVLSEVRELIKHHHFEEANQLMKKYFNKTLELM